MPRLSEYAQPRAADADAGANKRTAMSRGPPDIGGLISCAQLRLAIPKRARNPHPLRRRRSLKVDNFTYQTSKEDLMEEFGKYGTVADCYIPKDHNTGQSRGFGFIRFNTEEEADAAMKGCDGKELLGRALRVSVAQHARPALPPRHSQFGGGGGDRGRNGDDRGRNGDRDRRRSRSRSRDRRRRSRSRSRDRDRDRRRRRSPSSDSSDERRRRRKKEERRKREEEERRERKRSPSPSPKRSDSRDRKRDSPKRDDDDE